MKKSWIWILVIFVGSMPVGSALQYYFAGEPYRNSTQRNWAVVGQAAFGILVMALGLFKQIQAGKTPSPKNDDESNLDLNR
jgi:hypothetical protein